MQGAWMFQSPFRVSACTCARYRKELKQNRGAALDVSTQRKTVIQQIISYSPYLIAKLDPVRLS
jgi:hypothetical protein